MVLVCDEKRRLVPPRRGRQGAAPLSPSRGRECVVPSVFTPGPSKERGVGVRMSPVGLIPGLGLGLGLVFNQTQKRCSESVLEERRKALQTRPCQGSLVELAAVRRSPAGVLTGAIREAGPRGVRSWEKGAFVPPIRRFSSWACCWPGPCWCVCEPGVFSSGQQTGRQIQNGRWLCLEFMELISNTMSNTFLGVKDT